MPRHDWRNDDDFTTRDDRERSYGYGDRGRGYADYERQDRGAFFGGRGENGSRRAPRMGGWESLLNDESSGLRDRSEYRHENGYGPDDNRRGIPTDETERLIASNKVEGTPVYDRSGDRLGSIHNFMRYYPLDWDQLSYDTRLGGYHIDMSEDQLKSRGSWDRSERWQDRESRMRSDRERMGRDRDYERRMRDPW